MAAPELERIEKKLEEITNTIKKLEPILERIEELERKGILDLMLKSIEKLAESFEMLADPKNLGLLASLLSTIEAFSRIDPSLFTVVTDSLSNCIVKTQTPEVIRTVANPPQIGGLFGILKMLNDPDVKKLLGLIYVYAKIIGGCLPEELKPKLEHLEKLYEARMKTVKK